MKRTVTVWVTSNLVGCKHSTDFEVDEDATDEEIEEMAMDTKAQLMDWGYDVKEINS